MAAVSIGNHAALRVNRIEREKVRTFYLDVLGGQLTRELDDKDDIRLGSDFYLALLYTRGDGATVDQGVSYAAEDALAEDDFLKAMFLELKADDVENTKRRIIASGVRVLNVPDPHLYFQAPGGQVFRLVGQDEDLSAYEGGRHD
ncbi:VOC family protein [Pseudonocardia acidicola]|uniref:VOC family protein n=1 Tax=Pseudonocardia acidicola TaxID=2724939 RepID=A0ABX1S6J2_9PSEU|nr:VOC family protein [Pseudonocardia acidicola]NMH96539.1 VOC family protein [Pseudonocardia acidicola]